MVINNDLFWWFSTRWMKQNMCISCRFLHHPIVFRNLSWWGTCPSSLSGCASTRVYVCEATDGWIFLRSYLDFPMYVLVPMIVSMILQSWRWWIFHVGIPHTTWRICYSPNWNDYQTGLGMSRFGMNPQTDMGIPIPIWGPYFECRSNLVTIKVAPQIRINTKPVWVSDWKIPKPVRGSPFCYGD